MYSGKSDQGSDHYADLLGREFGLSSPDNIGGNDFLQGQLDPNKPISDFSNPYKAMGSINFEGGTSQGQSNYATKPSLLDPGDFFGDFKSDTPVMRGKPGGFQDSSFPNIDLDDKGLFDSAQKTSMAGDPRSDVDPFQLFLNPAQASQLLHKNKTQTPTGYGKNLYSSTTGSFSLESGAQETNATNSKFQENPATYSSNNDEGYDNPRWQGTSLQHNPSVDPSKELYSQNNPPQLRHQQQLSSQPMQTSQQQPQQQVLRSGIPNQQQYSEQDKSMPNSSYMNQQAPNKFDQGYLSRFAAQYPGIPAHIARGLAGSNPDMSMMMGQTGNPSNIDPKNPMVPKTGMSQSRPQDYGIRQLQHSYGMPGMMPNPQQFQENMRRQQSTPDTGNQRPETGNLSTQGQDYPMQRGNSADQYKGLPMDMARMRKADPTQDPFFNRASSSEFPSLPTDMPYGDPSQRQMPGRSNSSAGQSKVNGSYEPISSNKELLNQAIAQGLIPPDKMAPFNPKMQMMNVQGIPQKYQQMQRPNMNPMQQQNPQAANMQQQQQLNPTQQKTQAQLLQQQQQQKLQAQLQAQGMQPLQQQKSQPQLPGQPQPLQQQNSQPQTQNPAQPQPLQQQKSQSQLYGQAGPQQLQQQKSQSQLQGGQPGPQQLQQQKSQSQMQGQAQTFQSAQYPQQYTQQQLQQMNPNTQSELQKRMMSQMKNMAPHQQFKWNPNQDPQGMMQQNPNYGAYQGIPQQTKSQFPQDFERSGVQGQPQQLGYSQEILSGKVLPSKEELKGGKFQIENLKQSTSGQQQTMVGQQQTLAGQQQQQHLLRHQQESQEPPQPHQLGRFPSGNQKLPPQQLLRAQSDSQGASQYQQQMANKTGDSQNLRGQMPQQRLMDPQQMAMAQQKIHGQYSAEGMSNYQQNPKYFDSKFSMEAQKMKHPQMSLQQYQQQQSQSQASGQPLPMSRSQSLQQPSQMSSQSQQMQSQVGQAQTQQQMPNLTPQQLQQQKQLMSRSRSEGPNMTMGNYPLSEGQDPALTKQSSQITDPNFMPNPQQLESSSSQDPSKKMPPMQNWQYGSTRQPSQQPQPGGQYLLPQYQQFKGNGPSMPKMAGNYYPGGPADPTQSKNRPLSYPPGMPLPGQHADTAKSLSNPNFQGQGATADLPTQQGSKQMGLMNPNLNPQYTPQAKLNTPQHGAMQQPQNMKQFPPQIQDPEIRNLQELIKTLNYPCRGDSQNLNDIRSKLPPDVRKGLASAPITENPMHMFKNLNPLLPHPDATGNLNPNMPILNRDPRMMDPSFGPHSNFPYRPPPSFAMNEPAKPTLGNSAGPESTSMPMQFSADNPISKEKPVKKRQRRSKKGGEVEQEGDLEKPIKQRKPRKKKSPGPVVEDTKIKIDMEPEKLPEMSTLLPSLSGLSTKKMESESMPKRINKKKKKIVESEDEFDDLYGDASNYNDEDFFEEKRGNGKQRIGARMAPTRKSQKYDKLEKLETPKKKASTPGTNVSKKGAPKKYSDIVKAISLLEGFDWLDDTNTKGLITKKGKSALNPLAQIVKSMSGSAFWFYVCAQAFPRAPFIQNTVEEQFNASQEKLDSLELGFTSKILKTARRLEMKDREVLTEEERQCYNKINELLKQKALEFRMMSSENQLYSNLSFDAEVKSEYTIQDDEWILQLRSKINDFAVQTAGTDCSDYPNVLKKFELSDLIILLENEKKERARNNGKGLSLLKEKAQRELEKEKIFLPKDPDFEDILIDMKAKLDEEESYLSFLEKKQVEGKDIVAKTSEKESKGGIATKRPKVLTEDIVCQVCNDGDYSEENLIVLCSKCNVSVHQLCYGIGKIPQEDWICDLCKEFGVAGKYMRCPLCSNRSGALKPTVVPITTEMFQHTNPEFHKYLVYCVNNSDPNKNKANSSRNGMDIEPPKPNSNGLPLSNLSLLDESLDGNGEKQQQDLYYDYHEEMTKTYDDNDLPNEPRPDFVWAHITCAQFIPELFFQDKTSLTKIDGFNKLDSDRFYHECNICGKINGATIHCEKNGCKKRFHAECARRANFSLETKEIDHAQVVGDFMVMNRKSAYVIYCEKHIPLKLRRLLEAKEKKEKEEISKFCKAIERIYQAYLAEQKTARLYSSEYRIDPAMADVEIPSLSSSKKKKPKGDGDNDQFMQMIEELRWKVPESKHIIYLDRKQSFVPDPETGMERAVEYYEVTNTLVVQNDPHRRLTPRDEIWTHLQYKDYTPLQKYNKYRRLLTSGVGKSQLSENLLEPSPSKKMAKKYVKSTTSAAQKSKKITPPKAETVVKEEEIVVKQEIQPLQPATGQECTLCKASAVINGDYEPLIKCDVCSKSYHFKCVGQSVNETNIVWFCPSCTGFTNQNLKIEDEIQSIHEKIEEQIDSKNVDFGFGNIGPSDVYLESGSDSENRRKRDPFMSSDREREHQNKLRTDFDEFFSHPGGLGNQDSLF